MTILIQIAIIIIIIIIIIIVKIVLFSFLYPLYCWQIPRQIFRYWCCIYYFSFFQNLHI